MGLACRGELRDQVLVSEPPNFPPGISGGSPSIIGDWAHSDTTTSTDSTGTTTPVAITTRWHFGSDKSCSVTTTTVVIQTGSTTATTKTCTYIDSGSDVAVSYSDGTSDDIPYSFSTDTPNDLQLGGKDYTRAS